MSNPATADNDTLCAEAAKMLGQIKEAEANLRRMRFRRGELLGEMRRRGLGATDVPAPDTNLWSAARVATYCGVDHRTISRYFADGKLPEPVAFAPGPQWEPDAIIKWHEDRPYHGRRRGRQRGRSRT